MADEKQDKAPAKSARADRLAHELRANLARRKAQARSRDADGKPPASPDEEAGSDAPAQADE